MDWLFTYADPSIDWDYAMITLVVRFIGVFVVMAAVQVAMQAASRGIRTMESRAAGRKAAPAAAVAAEAPMMSLDVSSIADGDATLDGRTVAAIGLALAMEAEHKAAAARRAAPARPAGTASAWAISGRLRGMR